MTDVQFYAHKWLSRMWDKDIEIEQLIVRRDVIVASMSGIGKYDAEHIPTQNGENPTETKNIEYSILSEQIEKKTIELASENILTYQVIDKVSDSMLRGMLINLCNNIAEMCRGPGEVRPGFRARSVI